MCKNCKAVLAVLKAVAGNGSVVTNAQHNSSVCGCKKQVVRTRDGKKVGATVPHGAFVGSVAKKTGGYHYCKTVAQVKRHSGRG